MKHVSCPEDACDMYRELACSMRRRGVKASVLYKVEKAIQMCKEAAEAEENTPKEAMQLVSEAQIEHGPTPLL